MKTNTQKGSVLSIVEIIVVVILVVVGGVYYFNTPAPAVKVDDSTNLPEPQLIGNDKDEHGCIPSAGYLWSEVKQACVRPWEEILQNQASSSIQVLYPKNGEKLIKGNQYIIRWNNSLVSKEYSKVLVSLVVAGKYGRNQPLSPDFSFITDNTGNYAWKVPDVVLNTMIPDGTGTIQNVDDQQVFKIEINAYPMVSEMGGDPFGYSDGYFTIVSSKRDVMANPTILVLYPRSDYSLMIGQVSYIAWDSSGLGTSTVDIQLRNDSCIGGQQDCLRLRKIGSSLASTGEYHWDSVKYLCKDIGCKKTILNGSNYKILVCKVGSDICGESDYFTITN